MSQPAIGIWFIGAQGGIATTVSVGLASLQKKLTDENGLASSLPRFRRLNLADWGAFTIGGDAIRETTYAAEALQLREKSGVFSPAQLEQVRRTLDDFDRNIRQGTLINVGGTIEALAGETALKTRG